MRTEIWVSVCWELREGRAQLISFHFSPPHSPCFWLPLLSEFLFLLSRAGRSPFPPQLNSKKETYRFQWSLFIKAADWRVCLSCQIVRILEPLLARATSKIKMGRAAPIVRRPDHCDSHGWRTFTIADRLRNESSIIFSIVKCDRSSPYQPIGLWTIRMSGQATLLPRLYSVGRRAGIFLRQSAQSGNTPKPLSSARGPTKENRKRYR